MCVLVFKTADVNIARHGITWQASFEAASAARCSHKSHQSTVYYDKPGRTSSPSVVVLIRIRGSETGGPIRRRFRPEPCIVDENFLR